MSTRNPWHCHDCPIAVPSLSKAREHSKSSGPIYRRGKMMRHVLTQNEANAIVDRALDADSRGYSA